jgi:hypothetical protein
MTWLGTLDTRRARWAAEQAAGQDREHLHHCVTCTRAARLRKVTERCPEGLKLAGARRTTADRLRTERELDKLPPPGQAALFGVGELTGGGSG